MSELAWFIGMVIGLFVLIVGFAWAADAHATHKRHKQGVKIENIRAQLLLASTDPHEIESFLLAKEPYLTQELIQQLIARVLELRYDEEINRGLQEKFRVAEEQADQKCSDVCVEDDSSEIKPIKQTKRKRKSKVK